MPAPVVSTFPAVKAYLISTVKALSALSSVTVTYGHPGRELTQEHLWLAGTKALGHVWGPFGQLSKDESYTMAGFVLVTRSGDSQQEATERAFAIFGAVDLALRTKQKISLGGTTGVIEVIVSPTDVLEGLTDEGRETLIEFDAAVKARI